MLLHIILLAALLGAAVLTACLGGFAGAAFLWQLPVFFLGFFLALLLLAFLFLFACCATVNLKKPQEKDSPFFRQMLYLYAALAASLLQVKFQSKGFDKIPKSGRFLVVCNHLGYFDPIALHLHFRKNQLAFISKKENGAMFMINKLMHKTLCMPIDRENDRAALRTILRTIRLLKVDTASVAVFPEGYTSLDGKLHEFRNGVFKIALKANVPIVACTIQNSQYVFHNALRLRRTVVPMELMAVLPPEALQGKNTIEIGQIVHDLMAKNLETAGN